MTHLKVILVIIISLMVIILVVQNDNAMSETVQFRINPILFEEIKTPEISIYLVMIIAFLFGVISTGIYGMIERFRLKSRIKILSGNLQDKDKELNSLRSLPISSDDVGSGPANIT